ncbi:MAG: protein jag [Spirochaetaceae bacterium]|nr:MAG: protein jag [Spirochaetaceae bacterium]
MTREFEGKTEKDAIDAAISELGLERDEFDVEIVDTQKSGLFGMSKKVRIRVHTSSDYAPVNDTQPENDFEHGIIDFVAGMIERMGYTAEIVIKYREPAKLCLRIDSESSGILIGRKGQNLDALQLLANVVAGRLYGDEIKVILDTENYRSRREESLVRLAHQVGDQVLREKGSRLLAPMNPFERRLIHTSLTDIENIATKSEGEGLYKQVRVYYRGAGQ